ncbi:MAG: thiamine phosphate synthase [Cypionkella sp.]
MNLSVYFVTPDATDLPLEQLVAQAVKGGATIVQLRNKTASDGEMTRIAGSLVSLLAPLGIPLIVNDRVEVALNSGAAGLHIGQKDAPVAEVRRLIGPDLLLGLSIETLAQLSAMPAGVVDYIGAGPVRATATKPDHAAPIGLEGLARIVAASPVPVVAIGGLRLADVTAVKAAGAAGLALVSAIAGAADPEAAARGFALAWGRV